MPASDLGQLRLIGAGLPRTGTKSLQVALERLLGGRCHHMHEIFGHPEQVPAWRAAMSGQQPDWPSMLAGYVATVDWPAAAFWRELAAAFPDALVLLSVRSDAESWWASANQTVLEVAREEPPPEEEWHRLLLELLENRFTSDWRDPDSAMAGYERHTQAVREAGFGERLVEWQPQDGWGPICAALGLPVPGEPFPHLNRRSEWT